MSQFYLDDAKEMASDQFQAAADFGREELAKYEGQLRDAENALKRE